MGQAIDATGIQFRMLNRSKGPAMHSPRAQADKKAYQAEIKRLVETAARKLNIDPTELRRKNFITSFPHQTPVIMAYDTGDFNASLDAALKAIDYAGFAARKAASQRAGKLRGIGLSCYIEACGIAPSKAVGSLGAGVGLWESAEVRVNPVGTIEVLTGSHSHGQGHETTFAQVVADRLGIPLDQVSIVHGDTDKVQFGMGTYGSRSAAVGISAIVKALEEIKYEGTNATYSFPTTKEPAWAYHQFVDVPFTIIQYTEMNQTPGDAAVVYPEKWATTDKILP